MVNLLNKVIVKRHYLLLEESDVTKTLNVINRYSTLLINLRLAVGNCGWANEPTRWFIHFDISQDKWNAIKEDLKKENLNNIFEEVKKLVEERI